MKKHKFGCPDKELEELQRFIIDRGFGKTEVCYGARCKGCGKLQLVPSIGPESWYPSDAITEEEAMEKLNKEYV